MPESLEKHTGSEDVARVRIVKRSKSFCPDDLLCESPKKIEHGRKAAKKSFSADLRKTNCYNSCPNPSQGYSSLVDNSSYPSSMPMSDRANSVDSDANSLNGQWPSGTPTQDPDEPKTHKIKGPESKPNSQLTPIKEVEEEEEEHEEVEDEESDEAPEDHESGEAQDGYESDEAHESDVSDEAHDDNESHEDH